MYVHKHEAIGLELGLGTRAQVYTAIKCFMHSTAVASHYMNTTNMFTGIILDYVCVCVQYGYELQLCPGGGRLTYLRPTVNALTYFTSKWLHCL